MAILRRRLWLFSAAVLVVVLAAIIFTAAQPKVYTASSAVILNVRQQQVANLPDTTQAGAMDDRTASVVDTEAELLNSIRMAGLVADALHLERDPEFNQALDPNEPVPTKVDAVTARQWRAGTAAMVKSNVMASRTGTTYIINIAFTASTPTKAALIANTYASEYLADQKEAKVSATDEASGFLNTRLQQLKDQVQTAEDAVAQYKIANNLMSASGQTLTEQEISTYNTQAAAARVSLADAEARLAVARQQKARSASGEDIGESLKSPVVQNLRAQRGMVSAQAASLAERYGPKYPDLIKAQTELADIDSQIQAEIKRIMSGLEGDVSAARQRLNATESSVASAHGALASNNRASISLGELERNAQAVRSLYETFLNRYKETSAQAGSATADARIVSYAEPPGVPSAPKPLMNIAIGVVLGVGIGLGLVVLAELIDPTLSTSDDVHRKLMMHYLGAVPLLSSLPIKGGGSPTENIARNPESAFSEAFRSLSASVLYPRNDRPIQVLAVSSSLPGEGKTVTSVCLARSRALQGHRTILLDCDLRRGAATKVGGARPTAGLLEVLNGEAKLDDVTLRDKETGLDVLPLRSVATAAKNVFASDAMDELLDFLRTRYELIILDTGPVLAASETRILDRKSVV